MHFSNESQLGNVLMAKSTMAESQTVSVVWLMAAATRTSLYKISPD